MTKPKAAPLVRELVPTGVASRRTGISRTTLHRWIKAGLLEEGAHFMPGPFPTSPKRWDVPALEQRITQLRTLPTNPATVAAATEQQEGGTDA